MMQPIRRNVKNVSGTEMDNSGIQMEEIRVKGGVNHLLKGERRVKIKIELGVSISGMNPGIKLQFWGF